MAAAAGGAGGASATVYVLRVGDGDTYKVGFTRGDLRRRVASLSTGSSCPLAAVYTAEVPTGWANRCEAFVHAELGDLSTTLESGGREFFQCDAPEAICGRVAQAVAVFVEAAAKAEALGLGKGGGTGEEAKVLAGGGSLGDLEDGSALELAFAERRRLHATIRKLDLQRGLLEEALLRRFTEPVAGADGRTLLTFRERTQRRVDVQRLRELYPEVAEEVTEMRTYRTPFFG
jgi:hypothetical protein